MPHLIHELEQMTRGSRETIKYFESMKLAHIRETKEMLDLKRDGMNKLSFGGVTLSVKQLHAIKSRITGQPLEEWEQRSLKRLREKYDKKSFTDLIIFLNKYNVGTYIMEFML
jgi:hypothetical protein